MRASDEHLSPYSATGTVLVQVLVGLAWRHAAPASCRPKGASLTWTRTFSPRCLLRLHGAAPGSGAGSSCSGAAARPPFARRPDAYACPRLRVAARSSRCYRVRARKREAREDAAPNSPLVSRRFPCCGGDIRGHPTAVRGSTFLQDAPTFLRRRPSAGALRFIASDPRSGGRLCRAA